jgi:hypothetical protein
MERVIGIQDCCFLLYPGKVWDAHEPEYEMNDVTQQFASCLSPVQLLLKKI